MVPRLILIDLMINNNLEFVHGPNSSCRLIVHSMMMAHTCYKANSGISIAISLNNMKIRGGFRSILRFPSLPKPLYMLYNNKALWKTDDRTIESACSELVKCKVESVSKLVFYFLISSWLNAYVFKAIRWLLKEALRQGDAIDKVMDNPAFGDLFKVPEASSKALETALAVGTQTSVQRLASTIMGNHAKKQLQEAIWNDPRWSGEVGSFVRILVN
jgi:hypothetical protein